MRWEVWRLPCQVSWWRVHLPYSTPGRGAPKKDAWTSMDKYGYVWVWCWQDGYGSNWCSTAPCQPNCTNDEVACGNDDHEPCLKANLYKPTRVVISLAAQPSTWLLHTFATTASDAKDDDNCEDDCEHDSFSSFFSATTVAVAAASSAWFATFS